MTMSLEVFEKLEAKVQQAIDGSIKELTGQVLHAGEGHHRVGLGGHHPVFDDGTHDTDMIAVQLVSVLAGELLDACLLYTSRCV